MSEPTIDKIRSCPVVHIYQLQFRVNVPYPLINITSLFRSWLERASLGSPVETDMCPRTLFSQEQPSVDSLCSSAELIIRAAWPPGRSTPPTGVCTSLMEVLNKVHCSTRCWFHPCPQYVGWAGPLVKEYHHSLLSLDSILMAPRFT